MRSVRTRSPPPSYPKAKKIPSAHSALDLGFLFLQVSRNLELPPLASLCHWKFKPLSSHEPIRLDHLATLHRFTDALDESRFYLIMVAVEATGAPLIPLFLSAASAARMDEEAAVRVAFRHAKKGLDALGSIFGSVYERCGTHIFRRRVRPFLVQSKVISDMELSDHFLFEDGLGTDVCHLCRAGFRAQPAVLAFLDTLFGFKEWHAGSTLSSAQEAEAFHTKVAGPTLKPGDIHLNRWTDLPSSHTRFLEDVKSSTDFYTFVSSSRPYNHSLTLAYDRCISSITTVLDKQNQLASNYALDGSLGTAPLDLCPESKTAVKKANPSSEQWQSHPQRLASDSLIPFLKRASAATREPIIQIEWLPRLRGDASKIGRVTRHLSSELDTKADDKEGDGDFVDLADGRQQD